ncbi:choice-of-anchor P family protein [Actinokineospora bangkokensis]|uniref:Gram-positive cocci surface proteins LPxTG domain-containing protein n=1 Tax=Actinokineospora bangkokensis TaxID=1193682 RepID=A0A1Q9LJH2_9PSEU|nr:choice-of-anchor P family protein [Actinokineospora bangkokensis]OLR92144.1 hypothetical protein BJP25_22665 [Actinokineospora bangkokensis]
MRHRRLALACTAAGTAALTALLAHPATAQAGPTGSAFALSVQAQALGGTAAVSVGPGPVATYPAGGEKALAKVDLDKLNIHARVIDAKSGVTGGVLTSTATLADVNVMGKVKASVITATCSTGGSTPTGSSTLAELEVLGQKVAVAAHAKIELPGLTVAVDEQVKGPDGSLTVNALHITFGGGALAQLGSGELIISQAKCAAGSTTGGNDNGGNNGGGTTTKPTTPAGNTGDDEGTTTAAPAPTSTTPATGSGTDGSGDNGTTTGTRPVANQEDLASTGASGILPLTLGGTALLAAGGGAFWWARRKRAAL